MNIAIVSDDIVIGRGDGIDGLSIPESLVEVPNARLRVRDGGIVDVADVTTWYVDAAGQKHIVPGAGRATMQCAWDAKLVFEAGAWRGVSLDDVKAEHKALIDAAAEKERLKYITAGSGQSMVYQEKGAEADRYALDPAPVAANYPILSASVGADGATLADVAATVTATRRQWIALAAAIEGARLAAKVAIDEAETPEASAAVLAAYLAAPAGA